MRLAPALVLSLLSVAASAQPGRTTVAPAAVAPLAGMAEAYRPGPGVRASYRLGRADRRLGWRLGLEGAWFADRPRRFGLPRGDGLSVGATASAEVRLRGGQVPAHAVVGLGAFHEQAGRHVPYAVVPEVHAGVGLAFPAGRVEVVPEVGVQVVLSDLLSGGEFTPSLRVPVTVGVRF